VSSEIGFESGVGVDRSKMRREGVPNRGARMPKTTRGESNLDKCSQTCSKDDKY